ncbi:putative MFS family arabinose efflux permease [Sphaerotilus hippei]|uniref:Putative MFS family arabinose efflux permease n=1 Tax=Sphaerotilus hippei TaxID=744406 RepID=A0A318H2H5_9BURK|nr:MFS transporter [Sphaerotilus hippei]PXW97530.1 putative MFS family arabinose efflux permease [Sphaerotilus hippei]
MTPPESFRGRAALMAAHCAGMVDLVALPVWVGTLVSQFGLAPQQAGLLATLFLAGAVVASLVVAPRIARLPGRRVASLGYAVAAAAFAGVALGVVPASVPGSEAAYALLALLHAVAGVSAGAALSVTHGTIARSARPHRLFALVGMALGVFAILFMGATPPLVAAHGGSVLFMVFGGVMAVAAVVCAVAFPQTEEPAAAPSPAGSRADVAAPRAPLPPAVWAGMAGLAAMALVQAMTFSFLERVGDHRGFSAEAITGVLVALGVVNLLPAPLAAWLERRLPARSVLLGGALLQAVLAIIIMTATGLLPYAAAASVFAAVMIFTHTFAFGALAQMDRSGRALAATPAMLMVGAALGPILGGTLVQFLGYGSLAVAALVIGLGAFTCFLRLRIRPPEPGLARAPAGPLGVAADAHPR